MPMPPPISSESSLCFAVAARSLGNHASGAETVRPSARTTFSASALHETSTAVTSLLSTKVLMPFLQKEPSVLDYDRSNLSELVAAKTAIVRQFHRLKPKLRVSPRLRHVHVWRLATLQAEEKESIAADPQQGGHDLSLPRTGSTGRQTGRSPPLVTGSLKRSAAVPLTSARWGCLSCCWRGRTWPRDPECRRRRRHRRAGAEPLTGGTGPPPNGRRLRRRRESGR